MESILCVGGPADGNRVQTREYRIEVMKAPEFTYIKDVNPDEVPIKSENYDITTYYRRKFVGFNGKMFEVFMPENADPNSLIDSLLENYAIGGDTQRNYENRIEKLREESNKKSSVIIRFGYEIAHLKMMIKDMLGNPGKN